MSQLPKMNLLLKVTLFISLLAVEGSRENGIVHIVIIGGTGDLAQKYLWQGFFNLFRERSEQTLSFKLYGSTRGTADEETPRLLTILNTKVICRDLTDSLCDDAKGQFINQTQYIQLKTEQDYSQLGKHLEESAKQFDKEIGRVFYLSLPPRAYLSVSRLIHHHCRPQNNHTWLRLVLEKPFGRNKETALNMTKELISQFDESEIYRVDHYLGKGVVKHILPLRQMNRETLDQFLNKDHVDRVEISMLETVALKGRVDFYDEYGVICDVMQNHMLEMLTLIAMDLPSNVSDTAQTKANKLRLLKQIAQVQGRSLLTAQYEDYQKHGVEGTGNSNFSSNTATFAASLLKINSPRWHGVPFVLVSGKQLPERVSYVRVVFKNNIFSLTKSRPYTEAHSSLRQIVFHVEHGSESEPGVFVSKSIGNISLPKTLQVSNKVLPKTVYQQSSEDLLSYSLTNNVDAYSSVIANIIDGRHEHFVGSEHLLSLWDVWSGVLNTESGAVPRLYHSRNSDQLLAFTVTRDSISFKIRLENLENQMFNGQSEFYMALKPSEFLGGKLVVSETRDVIFRLSDDIKSVVVKAILERGVAHLAVSGGKTPISLFQHLAQMGPDLPWSDVHIWLVDERCVSLRDHRSNFNSLQETLLAFVNIPYLNIHLIGVESSGRVCDVKDRAAELYEELIRYWLPDLQFDMIVLGLGSDGHTASLFPHQPALQVNDRLVIMSTSPHLELTQRITLAYKTINSARNIAILATGAEKHSIIDLLQTPNSNKITYPVLGVHPSNGNMTWYFDHHCFYG